FRLPKRFAQVARRPVLQYVRAAVRALHRGSARRAAEKTPLNKTRALEQQYITELDKADALVNTNTPSLVLFDVGREAGYVFFILGGVCVSFGGASYVTSLLTLRRLMLLSRLTVLLHAGLVSVAALFWLCAVSLYIGRLELEIIHEEDEEEHGGDEGQDCAECRARRERRGAEEKGQDK
uniref:Transmembrane protein 160 n=1 Tax=Sinocyclocheilus rhinocerous TaxID=307959 RepID=A0A673G5W3_9TELE